MSEPIARYSFLPWLRQGLANSIKEAETSGHKVRASIDVDVVVGTDTSIPAGDRTLTSNINLIGPGDIIGVHGKAIVRTQPLDWITDFETNYFPFVEFYEENFPWKYTPAKAAGDKLTPWITLVVLKEGEFSEDKSIQGPLPVIEVNNPAKSFPRFDQLSAWCHVHVNDDLTPSEGTFKDKLENMIAANPDQASSRILCPRQLEPNTEYHAFLVPTFESGRKAGLAREVPGSLNAMACSWIDNDDFLYPYYFRYYFRTGEGGDFETLVRRLVPRPVDDRVGTRDMDVQKPGVGIPGITSHPELLLGGALKAPQTEFSNWPDPYPDNFQTALQERVNLAEKYKTSQPDADPIITPPLYARWHALQTTLNLPSSKGDVNWVHELNLDPRSRVPAGLGTNVVRKNQEKYMNSAWEQVGEILAANRFINFVIFAKEAVAAFYENQVKTLNSNKLLAFTSKFHPRILKNGSTVFKQVRDSKIPSVVMSPVFTKITRPGSSVIKGFRKYGMKLHQPEQVITEINDGKLQASPPKIDPEPMPGPSEVADEVKPNNIPEWLIRWVSKKWAKYLWIIMVIVVVILLLLTRVLSVPAWLSGIFLGILIIVLLLMSLRRQTKSYRELKDTDIFNVDVDELPESSDFSIAKPGVRTDFNAGSDDSAQARLFKTALTDMQNMLDESFVFPESEPPMLDIEGTATHITTEISPDIRFPLRAMNQLILPPSFKVQVVERFKPVMAYPKFDEPMYEPLRDINVELLIPNINLVPQNTITLLETNQKFIESYMVGLNHEMGRELLWREYFTDQRGSYFRQFWNVDNYVNLDTSLSEDELKEKLYDIKPIHLWSKLEKQGRFNNRDAEGDTSQVVLLVRGDVLKKYPNAIIYAHKAKWQRKDGEIQNHLPRELETIDPENPDPQKLKYPLYDAKVNPDIYFFGFDLTVEEASGESGVESDDDPGWFFAIKERPGEPKFGLDTNEDDTIPDVNTWNELSWNNVDVENNHVKMSNGSSINVAPADNPEGVKWSGNSDGSDVAYITYQMPVLVAVHASDMLKGLG